MGPALPHLLSWWSWRLLVVKVGEGGEIAGLVASEPTLRMMMMTMMVMLLMMLMMLTIIMMMVMVVVIDDDDDGSTRARG